MLKISGFAEISASRFNPNVQRTEIKTNRSNFILLDLMRFVRFLAKRLNKSAPWAQPNGDYDFTPGISATLNDRSYTVADAILQGLTPLPIEYRPFRTAFAQSALKLRRSDKQQTGAWASGTNTNIIELRRSDTTIPHHTLFPLIILLLTLRTAGV